MNRNKTSYKILMKGLEERKFTMEQWKLFGHIIQYRKEALASATLLGLGNIFYNNAMMTEFFMEGILKENLWQTRKTRQEVKRLFKAWKPFLKPKGLTNADDFANILTQGMRIRHYIKDARGVYREDNNFNLYSLTIDFKTEESTRSQLTIVVEIENKHRIHMNKALYIWIARMSKDLIRQKDLIENKGKYKYHDKNYKLTIKPTKFTVEEEA